MLQFNQSLVFASLGPVLPPQKIINLAFVHKTPILVSRQTPDIALGEMKIKVKKFDSVKDAAVKLLNLSTDRKAESYSLAY